MTVPDRLHITTDLGMVGTGRWTSAGFENPFREPVFLASTPAREHAEELVEALEDAASAVEWCARRLDGPAQRILAEKWAEEYRSFVAKVRSGNDPSKIEQENTNE